MSRPEPTSPGVIWLASLAALCGLAALLILVGRGETDPVRLSAAVTMTLGGTAVLVRVAVLGERWERLMAGPGARRLFSVAVVSALLLALGAGLLLIRHLAAFAR